MIHSDYIETLSLQVEGEDIGNFKSIISKLLVASSQSGFKKPFTVEERKFIEELAESIGVRKPEKNNIHAEKYTVS